MDATTGNGTSLTDAAAAAAAAVHETDIETATATEIATAGAMTATDEETIAKRDTDPHRATDATETLARDLETGRGTVPVTTAMVADRPGETETTTGGGETMIAATTDHPKGA